jgi:dTMP kinase
MIQFITFEGGDGTGKSTQLQALGSYLSGRGKSCILTREPGGTSVGKSIRRLLLEVGKQPITSPTELFLYLADRAQHIHEIVAPALAQGNIVLCDRHTDSTLAYQGYGRGIDIGLLRSLNDMANGAIKPDLTFLFDCPVEIALARTAARQFPAAPDARREDRFEREELKFHERVRAGFLELARAEPERFRIIDASRSVADVTREIKTIIDRELL